jgi:cation transport ATPase
MASRSIADMQPKERHWALAQVFAWIALAWIVVIGAYFILPFGRQSSANAVIRFVVVVILIGLVIWWQASRILKARHPEVRAIEAIGTILAVILVLFSALYLGMSHASASTFTQPLDHMGALYFTTTVFSTVGFGDITPRTDAARAIVSAQMIIDLILIGTVVRLLITTARASLSKSSAST